MSDKKKPTQKKKKKEPETIDESMEKLVHIHGKEAIRAWCMHNLKSDSFPACSRPKSSRREKLASGSPVDIEVGAPEVKETETPSPGKPRIRGWMNPN